MEKVYKIARVDGDKFVSWGISKYSVEYAVGKTTYPKIGKIFTFEKIAWAADFYKGHELGTQGCVLLECETDVWEIALRVAHMCFLSNVKDPIRAYWENQLPLENTDFAIYGTTCFTLWLLRSRM